MAKIVKWLIARAIKTVKTILQIPVYLLSVAGAATINAAIMIPLAIATELIMIHLGYNMIPPVISDPYKYMGIAEVLITMFAVGLFEETYFRYLVMDCMMGKWLKWGPTSALIVSAIMFGGAHMANAGWPFSLPQSIGAFGAGLWFGFLYRKYGLHFAIFTHAVYNIAVTLIPRLF